MERSLQLGRTGGADAQQRADGRAGTRRVSSGQGLGAFCRCGPYGQSVDDHYVVFLLWGAQAQRKGATIDTRRHCVLAAPHPRRYLLTGDS